MSRDDWMGPDGAGFESRQEWLSAVWPMVEARAHAICRHPADVDNFKHDAVIYLVLARGFDRLRNSELSPQEAYRRFALGTLRHFACQWLRREYRIKGQQITGVSQDALDQREDDGSRLTTAEIALLRRLLERLPEAMRDVVELRYAYGLPPDAIATHLDEPVGTIRSRLCRAMARLRAMSMEEKTDVVASVQEQNR